MRQRRPRCGLVLRPLLRVFAHALCLVSLLLLLRTNGILGLALSSHLNHHQVPIAFSSASTATSYQRLRQSSSSSSPSLWTLRANADSRNENDDNDADDDAAILPFLSSSLVSRRDAVWKIPLGIGFAYGYGKVVSQVVANTIRGTIYPEAHEARVRFTIEQTLLAAATASVAANDRRASSSGASSRTALRVLEVGIGSEARILRRGLYEPALRRLASLPSSSIQKVELTGIDIQLPSEKIQQQVQQERESMDKTTMPMQVSFVRQSVEDISFAADGYFDAIVCCLTLCSVENPRRAVQEMRRVLHRDGGTLGFVEHVAVDLGGDQAAAESSSLRFLEWQQRVLDPVQQLVADNCHLHRSTQETIYNVMGVLDPNDKAVGSSSISSSSSSSSRARVLHEERFLVDAMWPVSMQCCGVLQRLS